MDQGPSNDEDPHRDEMTSFLPLNINSKKQREVLDHINEVIELDLLESIPLSEFGTECIATMAFPTLFPDDKCDPTSFSLIR